MERLDFAKHGWPGLLVGLARENQLARHCYSRVNDFKASRSWRHNFVRILVGPADEDDTSPFSSQRELYEEYVVRCLLQIESSSVLYFERFQFLASVQCASIVTAQRENRRG